MACVDGAAGSPKASSGLCPAPPRHAPPLANGRQDKLFTSHICRSWRVLSLPFLPHVNSPPPSLPQPGGTNDKLNFPSANLAIALSTRRDSPSLEPRSPARQNTDRRKRDRPPTLPIPKRTHTMAQTLEQRRRNAKFAKDQEARMGKPEDPAKKRVKETPKSPISPVWIGVLGFLVVGGLLFEALSRMLG
ncbi:uncharacterized protein UV8b_03157 [Ustilaginoidea virens]|uniref:Stress-associated endoplasmic reticulum protein n=1 Tax=Ustilaginoidea virens TaxID=1159556 RepID=A0A8E5MGJ2_USTVR|nr:uncharacterized protein UV8b_03157 [Ustilaginoidea virens]QUC18916.1 hypothetical protein UV8b_03157 [Ustilaginoidea virens]